VVAAVGAARLVAARPWQRGPQRVALAGIDISHLLITGGMSGMGTLQVPLLAWWPSCRWKTSCHAETGV
jgi:hypothetical protein